MFASVQIEGKKNFFLQRDLVLPWVVFKEHARNLNFLPIYFSEDAHIWVCALNFNILKNYRLWTINFFRKLPLKHEYDRAL